MNNMSRGCENICKILMARDGLSHKEAAELVREAQSEIIEAAAYGDYDDAESILYDYLGLELDYLIDILY